MAVARRRRPDAGRYVSIAITEGLRAQEQAASAELSALSNWGRWGDEDERGALNFITPEKVLRALRTATKGVVYPLGQEIRGGRHGQYHSSRPYATGPLLQGRPPSLHFMSLDGGDYAAGAQAGSRGQTAEDTVMIAIHGTGSHIDGLARAWTDDKMYNSYSGNLVRSYGAIRLGVQNIGGVVTRGVLLDIAKYRGVERLEATDYITETDVLGACKQEGVTIESGDAVLVHTGWPKIWATDPESYSGLQPGVGASAALHLAKREISMLGADNTAVEPFDGWNPVTNRRLPDPRTELSRGLHEPYLRNLGIYLIEMLDLEKLAADHIYEFMFSLAPLLIKGGTGSPINPLAVA